MAKSNPSSQLSWLQKVALWVEDYGPNALNTFASVTFGVLGVLVTLPEDKIGVAISIYWFYASAMLMVFANIVLWLKNQEVTKLKVKLDKYDMFTKVTYDFVQDVLSDLANSVLKFSDNERISVYRNDGTNFVMIGRYSHNPEFCKKGRVIYPIDEGIIADAWKSGEVFISGLPDPHTDLDGYLNYSKEKYHIDKKTARGFKMKSRCYYGYAIDDLRGKTRTAVVAFESNQPNGLDRDFIKTILANGEARKLSDLLYKIQPVEPELLTAMKEGF